MKIFGGPYRSTYYLSTISEQIEKFNDLSNVRGMHIMQRGSGWRLLAYSSIFIISMFSWASENNFMAAQLAGQAQGPLVASEKARTRDVQGSRPSVPLKTLVQRALEAESIGEFKRIVIKAFNLIPSRWSSFYVDVLSRLDPVQDSEYITLMTDVLLGCLQKLSKEDAPLFRSSASRLLDCTKEEKLASNPSINKLRQLLIEMCSRDKTISTEQLKRDSEVAGSLSVQIPQDEEFENIDERIKAYRERAIKTQWQLEKAQAQMQRSQELGNNTGALEEAKACRALKMRALAIDRERIALEEKWRLKRAHVQADDAEKMMRVGDPLPTPAALNKERLEERDKRYHLLMSELTSSDDNEFANLEVAVRERLEKEEPRKQSHFSAKKVKIGF